MKDKNGNDIAVGAVVLVPFRVIKLGGTQSSLVHLETIDAYGHKNPHAGGAFEGRTKTAFWAEPAQVEVQK